MNDIGWPGAFESDGDTTFFDFRPYTTTLLIEHV